MVAIEALLNTGNVAVYRPAIEFGLTILNAGGDLPMGWSLVRAIGSAATPLCLSTNRLSPRSQRNSACGLNTWRKTPARAVMRKLAGRRSRSRLPDLIDNVIARPSVLRG